MDATDHVAAEKQLMMGTYIGNGTTTNPYLEQTSNFPGGASSFLPPVALSILEQDIAAETGRKGVIHVDPATATALLAEYLLHEVGDHLETFLGTPVIVGAGYIGAQPEGQAAAGVGESWAFSSGPIQAERGDMVLSDNLSDYLDWTTNRYVYRAERNILVAGDGIYSAAVLVDWASCCGGQLQV